MRQTCCRIVVIIYLFGTLGSGDPTFEKSDLFVNTFLNYLNNIPNHPYNYEEGVLQSAQKTDEHRYKIEVSLKGTDLHNVNAFKKCLGTLTDIEDSGVSVQSDYQCQDITSEEYVSKLSESVTTTEPPFVPIHLDNEVQTDTAVTSGEQFVAVPRVQPSVPCVGCASQVNPQAPGVNELATLGVKQLDRHEPNVKHSLKSVYEVQRQVQVVNGVRYILTMSVDYDNCSSSVMEACTENKICKVSVLEKPWVKLPDGSKYRAIVANNCTEDWLFDGSGEVISEDKSKSDEDKNVNLSKNSNTDFNDDFVKIVHNTDIQAQPNQEKVFTNEDLHKLQQQIITNNKYFEAITESFKFSNATDSINIHPDRVNEEETMRYRTENSASSKQSPEKVETNNLTEDKKKAINDLLNFFDFSGFNLKPNEIQETVREKRSYERDLQVMSLAEKFLNLKNNMDNAKNVYYLGQSMVDHINEMDMEIKTRALKDVIAAEEEFENHQHFFYLQIRIIIPCDKAVCKTDDTETKICNGVIERISEQNMQVLNSFCYDEEVKKSSKSIDFVPVDDPVLLKLADQVLKKIETESSHQNAMKIQKIINSNTQWITSIGSVTKIYLALVYTNCTKTLPLAARMNCVVLDQLGSNICEAVVYGKHVQNNDKITYNCMARSIDESFSKTQNSDINTNVDDPKILEMLQEALQYLEVQSNRNNKQKIVKVKSISTQIIAGLLTKIEFVVGYTVCTSETDVDVNRCQLLDEEPLRQCKAQIWDRPWLEDGKQTTVECDNSDNNKNEISNLRKKRSTNLNFVGGQNEQNPNDPLYRALTEESLNKYVEMTGQYQQHEVIRIKHVTTQVVSGILTRISFQIAPSNCKIKNTVTLSSSVCSFENIEKVNCQSLIWERPWLNRKEINVTCETINKKITKRQTGLQGRLVERDPSDVKYQQLAQDCLQKYLQTTGSLEPHKIIKVEKVTTQVVAGSLTRIDFKVEGPGDVLSCHSKVWEQAWLNKKDIDVDCKIDNQNAKAKRQIPGGLTEKDPNAPEYKQLAKESLQKYLQTSGSSGAHKVVKVEKVTTQVVAGLLTRIDFKVEGPGDVLSCHSKVWEQAWLNKKDIDVDCKIDNQNVRAKRQIDGGLTEKDPNAPEYKQLAEESLQKYLQTSGSSGAHKVVKVEKVTTQVVAGLLTRIDFKVEGPGDVLSCHSKVWEQAWLNKKDIDVDCKIDNQNVRAKRQIDGGLTEEDPNRPQYKQLAEESLQKYLQTSGSSGAHKVIKVEKVTTQVVAGTLTRIDFKVEGPGDVLSCHSKVWEQEWLNKKDIEVDCKIDNQNAKAKRQIEGGLTEKDPNAPEYKQLAEESLQKYLQTSGSSGAHKVIKVEKVTTQVVAGTLTRIDFKVEGPGDVLSCHSKVWEQEWLNKKDINVDCKIDNQNARAKRQIPGGLTEKNPNRPEYKQLAEESLQKYLQTSGSSGAHKVIKVEKVTTQVVAGTLTRIDFKVEGAGDVLSCHSKVWEQEWLNKKDIDVDCKIDNQNVRAKRQITGGLTEEDPNRPQYKQLAEESLQKYLQTSGSSGAHKVIKVEKVTTQVVAGTLTRIDFKVEGAGDVLSCHSKVWEQEWLNKKDIDVDCKIDNQNVRAKRQITGGLTEEDPNRPEYKQLAEESLQKYLQRSGSSGAHKVIKVEKVTTQVVAGSLTRIDFKVEGAGDVLSCHSKVWEQEWLNKKDIDVDCKIDNQNVRAKRQITGGLTEEDPNRPQYKQLAEESLQKYLQTSGSSGAHKVIKVEKVTTQVVAGTLTRIDFKVEGAGDVLSCHSKVWEQEWLNKKDIDVDCKIDNQNVRAKRQITGGLTEEDPNRPEYKQLAEESLQKYLQTSGSSGAHKVIKVIKVEKATMQVVAGTLTRIDFKVEGPGDVLSCHSKVWEQEWLNKKDIDVDCKIDNQNVRGKRQIKGGLTEKDPNAPQYKQLAEESLQKYLQTSGSSGAHKVIKVEKVTTQVVAGTLTRIDFKVEGAGDVLSCHSKVWEQEWLNKKDIDVDCKIDNQNVRAKRQITGGLTEKDPNRPEYKQLAEESLQKYLQTSGSSGAHKVIKVEKVTTQVVAGTLTRIDFKVEGPGDVLSCHSKVWEQEWLNKKDIEVDCKIDNQNAKAKRQIEGGLTEKDPNAPEYKQLAEESLQKYLQRSGSSGAHKVIKVEKVTTQVVAGSLTRIDFKVEGPGDVLSCHSKVWEQEWLNKKDINVDCKIDNQNARAKRQIPGGLTEKNPNRPEYKQLAEESLQKYLQTSGSSGAHKVIKVEKVTTQVVAGTLTRVDFKVEGPGDVLSCHSKVWEQEWLNKKDIDVDCKIDNQNARAKRQILGGLTEKDPNAPEYKQLAEESLQKYLQTSGSSGAHKVIKVEKVTTQVVAGTLTRIDFQVQGPADNLSCHSEVWEQLWLNKKEINVNCNVEYENKRIIREIGTLMEKDVSEEEYKFLANEATQRYQEKSKSKYAFKIIKIHNVKEQMIEGSLTIINYSISPTTCLLSEVETLDDCKLQNPTITLHCTAKIWDRPWIEVKKDIKVTCKKRRTYKRNIDISKKQYFREKRQLQLDEDDVDDDSRYYYADRAVQHLNERADMQNLQKLITIHAIQNSVQMGTLMIRMYIETAYTYCLRHGEEDLSSCDEINGLNHKLCFARIWPSPDDELVIKQISVVCDDEREFETITGISISTLIKKSLEQVERDPNIKYKQIHQGETSLIPSLDTSIPFKLNFLAASTNCSKDIDVYVPKNRFNCYIEPTILARMCQSYIWMVPNTRNIKDILVNCNQPGRTKRSLPVDSTNSTNEDVKIKQLVQESFIKLESQSLHRYKQRVLQINSYSTKISTGKLTTIDFDIAYTSCLKYEYVENITTCEFLEHLPRRHCVSRVFERLWIENGKDIDVTCEDDETPLEAHIEFESANTAMHLANQALKHIEAKYPHPYKQKVVRIFSLEKQEVAGIHYRMKIEVGYTNCLALSIEEKDCKVVDNLGLNKFCRVNVWVRPWTNHPPNYRINCDYQQGATSEIYHFLQAETLFHNFVATYRPDYINDHLQMQKKFTVFKKNVRKIHELNMFELGTARYAITRFADLTYEEFSSKYLGIKRTLKNENDIPFPEAEIPNVDLPEKFDWRDYDAVTEVKDQGSCGSCWAFSVTGNIEGQWKLQSGQLVSLSEQELVDCDKLDQGCNGGLPDNAYRAIEQLGGLETESDYPYDGEDEKCQFNKTLSKVQISGAINITSNETQMAQWLLQNGPISIGINANAMQFYVGGISHPWKMLCDPTSLDHGVLVVGFGVKEYPLFNKRLPYWIVKNSWGKYWGEQGYYRVYRGDGTCGLNQMASSAVI